MSSFRSRQAFTLIEVVSVIAIIATVSAITLVSFSGQRNTRVLERASRELVAALREAQGYALAGRSSAGEDNCWFGAFISASGANYSVVNRYRISGADTSCASGGTGIVSSYSLKEGVVFGGITPPRAIGFTLPRGEAIVGNGTTAMGPIMTSERIGVTKNSASRYVCVYSTGRILDNGSSTTCP